MVLMYGKEDPWVTPVWGQKLKKKRPDALYYELSPCGHCPGKSIWGGGVWCGRGRAVKVSMSDVGGWLGVYVGTSSCGIDM